MMGGSGHMQDMINKIKQNQSQRASRRASKRKLDAFGKSFPNKKLTFKEVSPEELEDIKLKNRLKAKKEKRVKNIVTVFIFIPLIIVVLYYARVLLYSIFN